MPAAEVRRTTDGKDLQGRQVNQWALRRATRSRVLRGAFKDDERLTLETLQAKVVNQKPTALNNNSYPKTRPQNQAPKTVTKMMTIVHVYTIRKPVSRACFCDLVFAPVVVFCRLDFGFDSRIFELEMA